MENEFELWWNSADGQGSIRMGTYLNEEAAKRAKVPALKELLEQCGPDEDRAGIEAGHFSIN